MPGLCFLVGTLCSKRLGRKEGSAPRLFRGPYGKIKDSLDPRFTGNSGEGLGGSILVGIGPVGRVPVKRWGTEIHCTGADGDTERRVRRRSKTIEALRFQEKYPPPVSDLGSGG